MEMTQEQTDAVAKIKLDWSVVSDPFVLYCSDETIGVWCGTKNHPKQIMIGIEKDGYSHS